MEKRQERSAYASQSVWLLEGRADAETQFAYTQRAEPEAHAVNIRHWARLTAAMLYLVAASFFVVILSVLATSWGQDGLSQILSEGHVAQHVTVYMLVAGGFSLVASFTLMSPFSLPRSARIILLAFALIVALAGLIFATPSVLVSVLPSLFLFRFHQGMTPSISMSTERQ